MYGASVYESPALLVMPWFRNRDVLQYLKEKPQADRYKLVGDSTYSVERPEAQNKHLPAPRRCGGPSVSPLEEHHTRRP